MPTRRSRPFLLTFFYAAVSIPMLAPITDFRHLDVASFGSDTRLVIWALAWTNHALLDGAPLFDANIFHPAKGTLAYSEHMLGISAFTLPIYALTRNPTLAYNLVWLASYVSCALAAHWLAYRVTRDHTASVIAGIAYAFCFFRMLHGHAHLQLLWACWIPLALIALDRWWERPTWRRLAALEACVLIQVLTSWYLAVLIALTLALFAGWRLTTNGRPGAAARVLLAQGVAAAGVAGIAVVPVALPYFALVGRTGGPTEALAGAAHLADYVTVPLNTLAGQWLASRGATLPWIWGERTLFLGFTALALAITGAIVALRGARRGGDAPFFAGLAAIALALAAGPSADAAVSGRFDWSPFGLFSQLPGMSLFRVPARFALLLTLSVAVLAAVGARPILARAGRWRLPAIAALMAVMLIEWRIVDFPGGRPSPAPIPQVYRYLARVPARAVVSLPHYSGTPEWYMEPDYQYFSTAHWHPIVNGYSRIEPPGHAERLAAIATFPDSGSATVLRELEVDYVVIHAARYRDGGRRVLDAVRESPHFNLEVQDSNDYVFRVVHEHAARGQQ